ncbi:MAG: hypothetical protein ACFE9Q_01695 [Candidatus Hodarchaeota archaeon]
MNFNENWNKRILGKLGYTACSSHDVYSILYNYKCIEKRKVYVYLFGKWFKQEAQFLSDIPFLLELFFLILMFGKALDLFHDMTYFTFSEAVVLLLLKVRFFTIIFEVTPFTLPRYGSNFL